MSSLVLPDTASSWPSGLSATPCGRIFGNSICRPCGVSTWLTGVTTRFVPWRPTVSVISESPCGLSVQLVQVSKTARRSKAARNSRLM